MKCKANLKWNTGYWLFAIVRYNYGYYNTHSFPPNLHPPSHHCHPRRQEARRKSKEKLNDVQELGQIEMTYKL